jgi:Ricin-type beta-trefoil lectin domain/Putative Ig domain
MSLLSVLTDGGKQVKRFLVLVSWIAVGAPILALTTAGTATAGIPHGTGAQRAQAHVVDLHRAYEAMLGRTAAGTIAGIVYPPGMGPSHARGGTECGEPYCPVSYGGGAVEIHPHVYLLLWGPDWVSDPSQAATAMWLEKFYSGLGEPGDDWSTITSQYGDSSGSPTFGNGVYEGYYNDLTTPPQGVAQSGLAAEADSFAQNQGITDLNDAQIVIATQSGTCPQGFEGVGCPGSGNYYCAWHSSSNVPYTNLPYMLDAGTACGENFVNPGTAGTDDGFSIVGGHEYAETITDPFPDTGWTDPNDPSYDEIADKCAWLPESNNVVLPTGSFAMQPLWSNSTDDCVINQGPQQDTVSVTNPENQSNYQFSSLSLTVGGGSSGGNALTWTASGLPTGLTIKTSDGLGVISGQITAPPTKANEPDTVTVTATDSTGAYGWATFQWTVAADVGTPITNQASSTCVNDHGYSISPGNQVTMWKCLDGAAEMFSQSSNAGELVVLGQCLTDGTAAHHGPGTLQVIDPCTGAANQVWYHNSKNEYVVEENFLCLTDPGGSTLNGEPILVEKCTDAKDQRWSGS